MKKIFCIANNCIKKKEKNINQDIKENYLKKNILDIEYSIYFIYTLHICCKNICDVTLSSVMSAENFELSLFFFCNEKNAIWKSIILINIFF